MWKKVRDNLDSGMEKIKWFSSLLAERLKIEFSIIKLSSDREKREKHRAEKMRLIGERVFELRNNSDKNTLSDNVITESIAEIEKFDAEIEDIKKKVSEISKIEG
ncbi:MAG: hypothetical protein HY754_05160 [Nitrospirae bacterium]|nr:hypothetical protein [Nitrospirota bacterium]